MQKKGWIRIVEAMMAILLIAAVVLIAISSNQRLNQDNSQKIYTIEATMLKEIQFNDSARAEILNIPSGSVPVSWSQFSTIAPNTKLIITQDSPTSMQCEGRICSTSDPCLLEKENTPSKTVYSQDVIISASLTTYNPLLLKVFCW